MGILSRWVKWEVADGMRANVASKRHFSAVELVVA